MNRLLAAIGIAVVVLLGAIAYELHSLNRWLSPPARAAARVTGSATAIAARPETPEERKARLNREIAEMDRHVEDLKYRLTHRADGSLIQSSTRPAKPGADRRQSEGK